MFPSVGMTANPSPIIFWEKTGSATSETGTTIPFAGEYKSSFSTGSVSFLSTFLKKPNMLSPLSYLNELMLKLVHFILT